MIESIQNTCTNFIVQADISPSVDWISRGKSPLPPLSLLSPSSLPPPPLLPLLSLLSPSARLLISFAEHVSEPVHGGCGVHRGGPPPRRVRRCHEPLPRSQQNNPLHPHPLLLLLFLLFLLLLLGTSWQPDYN